MAGGRASLGDNGPATSARLNAPTGVTVDPNGNLYIADSGNSRIREVSNAVISTVAGNGTPGFSGDNGPAAGAQLANPYGLAIDLAGNLYIADSSNNLVRKVSNGTIATVAGNGTPGFSGDNGPAIRAQLASPAGVAVDSGGNLYIADTLNNLVRKVSGGVITTMAGNGTPGFGGDGGPATSAQLYAPSGIAVDSAGNLYIADTYNGSIRKISGGVIATVAGIGTSGFGGDNGPATSAQLDNPYGLAVDSGGRVYAADFDNNRVRVLTPVIPCTYSLSPTAAQAAISGGNLTVGVRTAASCSWAIAGLPGWIAVAGASSGLGSASVTLMVAPNTGASLSATILIGGASFTVTQPAAAACVYSLSPGGQAFGAAGGTGTINVAVSTGCPWSAASNASWIAITGGNSGNGNGSVSFQAAPNPGAARSGTVTVAGLLSFTVEEADASLSGLTSWTTTITLLNTSSSQAQMRLNFFDDNGKPLALPLTFPQSSSASAAGPLLASSLDRTLKPGAQLVVQSTGPNSQPTLAGWAQVLTNGALGGFAVFSQAIGNTNQQAEVPLDTRNSADYVVPFDNTNGSSTAVALANIFVQAVTTAVSIRDDAGNVILSDTITLPAMGHASFTLADRYGSVTAQRRGTLEFTTPSPGLISVLGLSFNATGAFSTIPTIAPFR